MVGLHGATRTQIRIQTEHQGRDCESKLDLTKEVGGLSIENTVEGEGCELREMEGKLQCNRKEMDHLIEEKNGLIVELQD